MTTPSFILASSSPYRAQLLKQLGITFTQSAPNIDESPLPNELGSDYVGRMAHEKAQKVGKQFPSHWIIGSDQTCLIDNKVTGKSGNSTIALQQLKSVQGKKVTFLTGLCLLNCETEQSFNLVEKFNVYFRQLAEDDLIRYIELEQPFDCAGSFKVEGLGIHLFEKLEGRDPNSLIGLPLIGLSDLLREAGFNPLQLINT